MKARLIWWLVFISAATPSIYFACLFVFSPRSLGIDPGETLLQESGQWSFRILLFTLACSSLRRIGLKRAMRFRRMLGLFSFYYASLHLMVYLLGWINLDLTIFIEDLLQRPFIYIGMFAWIILLVLAITSVKRLIKILRKNWQRIHRLVYLAAMLVLIHLWMQARASLAEPVFYLCILLLLFGERIVRNRIHPRRLKASN